MGEEFAQVLDILTTENAALVRMMEKVLVTVQDDAKTRAMHGFDFGAEMMKQGLDLAPVDVRARRILEQTAQQVQMLVTHDTLPVPFMAEAGATILMAY